MSTPEINLNQTSQTNSGQRPKTESQPLSHSLFVGLGVAALLLGVVIYSGIHQRAMAATNLGTVTERAAVATVNVVEPKSGAGLEEIDLPGTTQAFIDTPIFARTNGYLKQWYFDIGAHVEQGQLLAVIETPELDQQLGEAQANLKTAQANEKLAEITATRWQNLLKTDSVSKQETDVAVQDLSAKQSTVESMTADVQRLEQLQSYEKVYAPFSGVITARDTDVGALINEGCPGYGGGATGTVSYGGGESPAHLCLCAGSRLRSSPEWRQSTADSGRIPWRNVSGDDCAQLRRNRSQLKNIERGS